MINWLKTEILKLALWLREGDTLTVHWNGTPITSATIKESTTVAEVKIGKFENEFGLNKSLVCVLGN